jgi:hypothetical protein
VEAGSRALGHMANADRPIADARLLLDDGDCKMPRITLRSCEDRKQICEGSSRAGPQVSAILAGSPSAAAGAKSGVHGLFRGPYFAAVLFVLGCTLTRSPIQVTSQIEVSAQVSVEAGSRALGHMANADRPIADARLLVIRQPE